MTDLGTFPGRQGSYATAINNHNQIIGITVQAGESRAVLWTLRSG